MIIPKWVTFSRDEAGKQVTVSDYMVVPAGRIYRTITTIQVSNYTGGAPGLSTSVAQTFVPD